MRWTALASDERKRRIYSWIYLKSFPESIRLAMVADPGFVAEIGLEGELSNTISFGSGPTFRVSDLLSAVRKSDESEHHAMLLDIDTQSWDVSIEVDDEGIAKAFIARENEVCEYSGAAFVLKDAEKRIQALDKASSEYGLPRKDQDSWRAILEQKVLSDREVSLLFQEFEATPVKFSQRLGMAIREGVSKIDDLVPAQKRYYERIVGELGGSNSPSEHAKKGAQQATDELLQWDFKTGFLLALSACAHSCFSAVIPVDNIPIDIVIESLADIVESGDRLTQVAAVEACLPLSLKHHELQGYVAGLIEAILDDDPEQDTSGFFALSRLFVFIYGEFSCRGILRNMPPFYRRQAAFAHASIVLRVIKKSGADLLSLCEWGVERDALSYYAQALVDMRLEPRWDPEYVSPVQLKQESIGRLLALGAAYKDRLVNGQLADVLSSDSEKKSSVAANVEALKPFYPGPLEGGQPPKVEIPEDLLQAIEDQLSTPELGTESFIALINTSNVFELEHELSVRVAEKLKKDKHKVFRAANTGEMANVLSGLARVAAITRSEALAQEVWILVRKYWADPAHSRTVSNVMRILLLAAAAHSGRLEWISFVGRCCEEMAFKVTDKTEAQELQMFVHALCKAEPDLWTVIGAADAALSAIT